MTGSRYTPGDASPALAERRDDRISDALAPVLFGLVADGAPHRLGELRSRAATALDAVPSTADIETGLEALETAGVPLLRDGDAVRSDAATPLHAEAIRRLLPSHWEVRVAWASGSTNTALLARVRARTKPDQPLLFASELQDAGRGRLGRRWRSAPGASLTLSLALRVDRPLAALDGVTLVCGLAVRAAVAQCGVRAALKWPNDLLVDGRKLGGILVEAHALPNESPQAMSRATVLVVGVGLNVLPRGRGEPDAAAIDLASAGAPAVDRNRLAADLAVAVSTRLATFETTGFGGFVDDWNAADAFRDRPVQVGAAHDIAARVATIGIARGVDDRGALRLDSGGHIRRVVAGDVSLRPIEPGGTTVGGNPGGEP